MQEEIEQFNNQNGNVNYTVKELIAGLHTKVDRIQDQFSRRIEKCNNRFIDKMLFYKSIGILFTLLAALATYVVYAH